jgi:hypothetical protein
MRSDESKLHALFETQGFEYEWPDLNSPLFLSKVVLEERNFPVMVLASRLTAEEYFVMDRDFGSPEEKWAAFVQLHEAAREDCLKRGLDDVFCHVPPQIAVSFGRRLMRLGWERNLWPSFSRKLAVPTHDKREEGPCIYLPESSVKLIAAE